MCTVVRIALREFSPNVYPCAYKISKFRPKFCPMRIIIHINIAVLVEAPHTVHATANETGALPATLPKVLHPTISTIEDIKSWNFDCCKHRKNVHFCCFRVYPNPICRLRAERRLAQIDPMRFKFSNTAKEELPSKQNTICTLK